MITAAAAAWLSLRDRGMNAAETAEFMRWLQQDARHSAVFAELDRTWKEFDQLGGMVVGDPQKPNADLLAPRPRRPRYLRRTWLVTAGMAAAACVLFAVLLSRSKWDRIETPVGGFRNLELADGSVVQLNTDSAIETEFTRSERRLRVLRGEVFFTVAKDSSRPFLVTAGPIQVRAVGTAFNVRRRAGAIDVLVTEGRVRVDESRAGRTVLARPSATTESSLGAGERVVVVVPESASETQVTSAAVSPVSLVEQQRTLAWQERRLEFDGTPLGEVAAEFNRYNRRQLVIVDAALAGKRFSGTFRADGYEPLLRLLQSDFGVLVEAKGNDLVLRLEKP
ncbi:MAG: FecR domain-containing protein [Verrucomicrobiota bacterium]